jgi:xanthine dehydrogenase accessory factor
VDPLAAARDALAKGKRAAVVTVTALEGEPPSRAGLAFTLVEGGETFGSLGCDGFDRSAAIDAARSLETATALESVYDWDERSRIRVAVRPLHLGDTVADATVEPEVLVVGEGPVARALISLARTSGFRVRTATTSAQLSAGPQTYVVICGHDDEFSQPALRTLVASPARYLGLMGSRRHTGHLLADLRAAGHDDASLRRVHTPVGLDLGAETPEEIALAALAHIVAVRRGGTGAPIA